jgi:hypothetical protein
MDAFTSRLGTSQGRVQRADSEVVCVLGDLEPGRFHHLRAGDFVELAQIIDVAGVALVRVRGALRAPAEGRWRVSLRVGGVEVAALDGRPGNTRTVSDLAASVATLSGPTEIAIRLTLVEAA